MNAGAGYTKTEQKLLKDLRTLVQTGEDAIEAFRTLTSPFFSKVALQRFQCEDEKGRTVSTRPTDWTEISWSRLIKQYYQELSKSAFKREIKRLEKLKPKSTPTKPSTKPAAKEEKIVSNADYAAARYDSFRKVDINPYPHYFETDITIKGFKDAYDSIVVENGRTAPQSEQSVAGRVLSVRRSGESLVFATMYDTEGTGLQLFISAAKLSSESYPLMGLIRRGDFVGAVGIPYRTTVRGKQGELSLQCTELAMLSPCMRILPKIIKKNGQMVTELDDLETRYRKRCLDLLIHPEERKKMIMRHQVIRALQGYFDSQGYISVETPILNIQHGGASARPFVTRCNAFNMDLHARIATEIPLKKAIIGGLNRVYEIGKQFRNEAIDATHSPEFTSMEVYCAYEDVNYLLTMTEDLITGVVRTFTGSLKTTYNKTELDWSPPFQRIDLTAKLPEMIKADFPTFEMPVDLFTDKAVAYLSAVCQEVGVECSTPRTAARLLDKLIEHYIEPMCVQPTFLMNHWQVMSPLAKCHRSIPGATERFELFVNCTELCNAYTELNDPRAQLKAFQAQAKDQAMGDDEAPPIDLDYVEALHYGLPPTAGWGMGIDRLMMFLLNETTIRGVQFQPIMKPLDKKIMKPLDKKAQT